VKCDTLSLSPYTTKKKKKKKKKQREGEGFRIVMSPKSVAEIITLLFDIFYYKSKEWYNIL
jgi:hypothetical protein